MNKSIDIVSHTTLPLLFPHPFPSETGHKKAEKLNKLSNRNSVRSSIPFSEAVLPPCLSKF